MKLVNDNGDTSLCAAVAKRQRQLCWCHQYLNISHVNDKMAASVIIGNNHSHHRHSAIYFVQVSIFLYFIHP